MSGQNVPLKVWNTWNTNLSFIDNNIIIETGIDNIIDNIIDIIIDIGIIE